MAENMRIIKNIVRLDMKKSITCGKKEVMRKMLLVLSSLVIAGLVIKQKIWWPSAEQISSKQIQMTPVPTVVNPFDYFQRMDFTDLGISLVLPKNWNKKTVDSSVIFTPDPQSVPMAKISQLVISKIIKSQPDNKFSTDQEFYNWYQKSIMIASQAGEYKSANLAVYGKKAVKITYLEPENDFYSLTIWWRDQEINYYFTAMGNGEPGEEENEIFDWLAGQIKEI